MQYRERDWDDYRADLHDWLHGTPLMRRCNDMPTLWAPVVRLGPSERGGVRPVPRTRDVYRDPTTGRETVTSMWP